MIENLVDLNPYAQTALLFLLWWRIGAQNKRLVRLEALHMNGKKDKEKVRQNG